MATSSQKHSLICLLFVSLLILAAAQRGGSRSSSSSRSSSRSSNYHKTQNCTTVNGTTTCTYVDELGWLPVIIFVGIFVLLIAFSAFLVSRDEKRRKNVIDGVMKAYDAKCEEWPSVLDEQQRAAMLDEFMKRSYTMMINVKDQGEKYHCQIKVLDLKKENAYRYKISMSGSDEVGSSKLDGYLIFKADGMGFKLSKVYDDRTKARQTGKFDILFYEGAGTPDKLEGEWAYHGFETSNYYAGTWTMIET